MSGVLGHWHSERYGWTGITFLLTSWALETHGTAAAAADFSPWLLRTSSAPRQWLLWLLSTCSLGHWVTWTSSYEHQAEKLKLPDFQIVNVNFFIPVKRGLNVLIREFVSHSLRLIGMISLPPPLRSWLTLRLEVGNHLWPFATQERVPSSLYLFFL